MLKYSKKLSDGLKLHTRKVSIKPHERHKDLDKKLKKIVYKGN